MPDPTVAAVLDTYAQGKHDDAIASPGLDQALSRFLLRLRLEGNAWINADPNRASSRRSTLAAFVLDLAHARLETDWKQTRDVLEWTCAELRAAGPPTPFERAWHMAVLSLAGRARDRGWLLGVGTLLPGEQPRRRSMVPPVPAHMSHVSDRYPDDPAVRLEWITAWMWGRDAEPIRNIRPDFVEWDNPNRRTRQRDAVALLVPLAAEPALAGEARLRIAQLHFLLRDYAAAHAAARQVHDTGADQARRYVAHVIAARSLDAMDRRGAAKEEYAAAVALMPAAQSASLALIARQFVDDDRAAAITLNAMGEGDDPWRLFPYGSFSQWTARRAALRALETP